MTLVRRKAERGYALLLVYAMAASVAVMLYMEIPRAAFEAQRDKEQLLIDRGEQYTRAIQLYVRKYNRFPVDMQALENTQNIRFLRRQYVDPMTGKSEWRLVHVGPGGIFLDSLVHKPKKETSAPQNFITEMQQIGGSGATTADGVNLATRRRPSDGSAGPADGAVQNGSGQNPEQPGGPAASQPPINGPVMVLPDGRIVPATSTGQPSQTLRATQVQLAGQPFNGQPFNGQAPNEQLPSGVGVQQGNMSGFPGQPVNSPPPGFQNSPNAPSQAAANLINQILTTPRPNGLSGVEQGPAGQFGQPVPGIQGVPSGTSAQGSAGGQTIGGGIAGVASKLEREGIKLYNERSAYNEWEFVYDMTRDPLRGGGRGGMVAQPGGQTQPNQSPSGQPQPGASGIPPGFNVPAK